MSIKQQITRVVRDYEREVVFSLIVVLVALAAFGLGYLSAQVQERTPIIIEKKSE